MELNQIMPWHLDELRKNSLNLNHWLILERSMKGCDVGGYKDVKKLQSLLWADSTGCITRTGKEFLEKLSQLQEPQKKSKKVEPSSSQWDKEWAEMWQIWPRVRTVKELGSRGICNKDFRGSEANMKNKYIKAINTGKITAQQLNQAARSYIQNAIVDSVRKGTNELEFRSGMEPWFNQEKYLTWKDIPVPGTSRVRQMETDI